MRTLRVRDIMTTEVHTPHASASVAEAARELSAHCTVRPGDPVMTAVRLMAEENIHRAVVVSDDGRHVGIITPMDVMRALARGDGVQDGDYAHEERLDRHSDPEVAVSTVDLRTFDIAS